MLNLECFMIQRKCYFTVISKIKFLKTKGTTLFIKSSGCDGYDIGKTERCLKSKITEHDTKEREAILKHLSECELLKYCCWLYFFCHSSKKMNMTISI